MIILTPALVFCIFLGSVCVPKPIEYYDGEGCKNIQVINDDGTCPGLGLFAVSGNCSLIANCTSGELHPLLDSCLSGFIFNGKECIPTNDNDTMNCAQMNCVPSKNEAVAGDDDVHNETFQIVHTIDMEKNEDNRQNERIKIMDPVSMDINGDGLEEEKAKIIATIAEIKYELLHMKFSSSPQLQAIFEKMIKNSIAFKGAKEEEKTQLPSQVQSASNKGNDQEIKNASEEKPALNDSENALYSNTPSSSFFISKILMMICIWITTVSF